MRYDIYIYIYIYVIRQLKVKAVHGSYVYICCTSQLGRLQYNSLFVGLWVWGMRGNERNI